MSFDIALWITYSSLINGNLQFQVKNWVNIYFFSQITGSKVKEPAGTEHDSIYQYNLLPIYFFFHNLVNFFLIYNKYEI